MNISFRPRLLPYLTLGMGGIGLALRVWLFSTRVNYLVDTAHPANILLYILSGLFLLALFFSVRSLKPMKHYERLFPASRKNAAGCLLGGLAIGYGAIVMHRPLNNVLSIALLVLGLLSAAGLVFTGLCRYQGRRPHFTIPCVLTVYMILHTLNMCKAWNTISQLQLYFFPLMATIFLLLTCYQYAVLNVHAGKRRPFVLYSQAAAFFCLLSSNIDRFKFFYIGCAAWLVLDLCSLRTAARPSQGGAAE